MKNPKNEAPELSEDILPTDTEPYEPPTTPSSTPPAKKKKKLPGWVILPIIGVLALIGVLMSMLFKPAKTATALTVVSTQKGDVAEEYTTSGNVESELTKTFYSPVNANVDTFNAVVGQSVKEGDLLVSFDTSDLEKNNQQSQLNLDAAKAGNQSTIEQADQSASIAAQTQANMDQQIANTRQKVRDKQAEVNQLIDEANQEENSTSNAYTNYESQRKQMQDSVNTLKSKCDTAKNDLDTNSIKQNDLDATLRTEQTKLDTFPSDGSENEKKEIIDNITKLHTDIAEAKNERISFQSTYDKNVSDYNDALNDLSSFTFTGTPGTATQKLATAQAELSSLQSALEQQEASSSSSPTAKITDGQYKSMGIQEDLAELAKLSAEELVELGKKGIHADFNGVISNVQSAEGTAAMQGAALFTLVSNSDVSVKLEVPSGDFDKLKIGNKANIKIGEYTYKGTLTSIDKIATTNLKGNPVIGAKVHIDNPDANIYIGVTAKVTLSVAESKNVLCLSNEVVNTGTDGDFVYVIRDGEVKKQVVELGIASNSTVEIKSGLKEGDEVITDVTSTLEEGMKAIGVASAN